MRPSSRNRRSSIVGAHLRLNPIAQHVAKEDMAFLNACGLARSNPETDVGQGRQLASAFTGHAHGEGSQRMRALNRLADIRAVAGSGKPDHDITGLTEGFHLAREDCIVAVVITDGGKDRSLLSLRRASCCVSAWT